MRITDDKRCLLNVFNEIKFIVFDDVAAFYVAKVLVFIYVGISDIRPLPNLIPSSNFTFISCGHNVF